MRGSVMEGRRGPVTPWLVCCAAIVALTGCLPSAPAPTPTPPRSGLSPELSARLDAVLAKPLPPATPTRALSQAASPSPTPPPPATPVSTPLPATPPPMPGAARPPTASVAGAEAVGGAADVRVVRTVVHYDVAGVTARELIARFGLIGPQDRDGMRWPGYTDSRFDWRYRFSASGEQCRIESTTVDVAITVTLPRWLPPAGVQAALVAEWQRFASALDGHERGHVDIAERAGREIHGALRSLPPRACADIHSAADAAAQAVLERERQEHARYDRETEHGRTQGAILSQP